MTGSGSTPPAELSSRRNPLTPKLRRERRRGATNGQHVRAGEVARARARLGEGHAPVDAVLVPGAKPDESIPDPKGANRGPPPGFHLQTGISEGSREGLMIAILDPLWPATQRGSRHCGGGEGHARFCQCFLRLRSQTP
jgi:hypothetical protein